MGGFAVTDWIARHPDLFGKGVVMSGGGDQAKAKILASKSLWFFHGDQDSVIDLAQSQKMVDAIRKNGGHPQWTILKGRGHGPWDDLVTQPSTMIWLLQKSSNAPASISAFENETLVEH